MNYLAHLYFAQNNPESVLGNLLADFSKGVDISQFNEKVVLAMNNHRYIDKFTDQHEQVKALKQHLSPTRKRFSFVIADVVFDHFLAQQWSSYASISLKDFAELRYQQLSSTLPLMPLSMRFKIEAMIAQNWLEGYQNLDNIGHALDGISNRIRFKNQLLGAISEVEQHYQIFEQAFNVFFPQLIAHVHSLAIESGDTIPTVNKTFQL